MVETIGGTEARVPLCANPRWRAAASVVTSNKELVATHGAELLAMATPHGRVLSVRGQRGRRHAHHHAHAPMPGGQRHQRDRGHRQRHHRTSCSRKWRGRIWAFERGAEARPEPGLRRDHRPFRRTWTASTPSRKIAILASLAFGRHFYPAERAHPGHPGRDCEGHRAGGAAGLRRCKLIAWARRGDERQRGAGRGADARARGKTSWRAWRTCSTPCW